MAAANWSARLLPTSWITRSSMRRRRNARTSRSVITVKAASEGDRVLLSVIDQGPGIPEIHARARGRAFRASRSEPDGAGFGPRLEPRGRGCAPAWRRTEIRGQCARALRPPSRCRAEDLRGRDDGPGSSKEKPDPSAALASRITGSPIAAGQDTNRPIRGLDRRRQRPRRPGWNSRRCLRRIPPRRRMVSSLAHFSPYLWDLASSDAARLLRNPAIRSGHPSRRVADRCRRARGECRQ